MRAKRAPHPKLVRAGLLEGEVYTDDDDEEYEVRLPEGRLSVACESRKLTITVKLRNTRKKILVCGEKTRQNVPKPVDTMFRACESTEKIE